MKRRILLRIRGCFFRLLLTGFIVRLIDGRRPEIPLGRKGELEAERFYLKMGYWIIDRGFGEKTGEIDLITSDGQTVVFVEVKTRTSDSAGDPTEAVDEGKQRHIAQTARLFAVKNSLENSPIRFDVVSIIWPQNQSAQISHFPNAFEATGEFQLF